MFHKFEIIAHYHSETFNLNGIYDDELQIEPTDYAHHHACPACYGSNDNFDRYPRSHNLFEFGWFQQDASEHQNY